MAAVPGESAHSDLDFEVTDKTSIKATEVTDCKCPGEEFWNPATSTCVKKGGLGYECGFFPPDVQKEVCKDGLTCKSLAKSSTQYFHQGAAPASCQTCEANECPANAGCPSEFALSGAACATVTVTLKHTATGEHTAEHTAEATASATAEATATSGKEPLDATRTAKAEHESTAEATAEASANAGAEAKGEASKRVCIQLADVLKKLGMEDGNKVCSSCSAKVIFEGDAMAIDAAHAAAVEEAKRMGLMSAEDAAEKLAEEKAKAKAEEKAEEKAQAEAEKTAEAEAAAKAKEAAEEAAAEAAAAKTTTTTTTATTTTVTEPPAQEPPVQPPVPQPAPTPVKPATDPEVEVPRKMSPADVAAKLP